MGKVRATTLSEKFGFKDIDLYKPKHDEIILALMNKPFIFGLLFDEIDQHYDSSLYINCEHRNKGLCNILEEKEVENNKCPYFTKTWHKDRINCPYASEVFFDYCLASEELFQQIIDDIIIETEYIIKNDRDYEIGFVDVKISFKHYNNYHFGHYFKSKYFIRRYKDHSFPEPIYLEIKTKIDSYGAVMRQLNMYRTCGATPLILVTCDDRFKEAFINQGIKVIIIKNIKLPSTVSECFNRGLYNWSSLSTPEEIEK